MNDKRNYHAKEVMKKYEDLTDEEKKESDIHCEIQIAWLDTNPIATCGEMTKLESMQKMFELGYRAALKDVDNFKMGHCHACGNFDIFHAPIEYPKAAKELCRECAQ